MSMITYLVVAPEGRSIPGLGSREQGGVFVVPSDMADALDGIPGLERQQPPRKRSKVEAVEADAVEIEEGADDAR